LLHRGNLAPADEGLVSRGGESLSGIAKFG